MLSKISKTKKDLGLIVHYCVQTTVMGLVNHSLSHTNFDTRMNVNSVERKYKSLKKDFG